LGITKFRPLLRKVKKIRRIMRPRYGLRSGRILGPCGFLAGFEGSEEFFGEVIDKVKQD
jgi:hypothetical protein